VNNPVFARIWPFVASHEAEAVRILRRENLVGLSGRVLEVWCRHWDELPQLPSTVRQVIAVEARAADGSPGSRRSAGRPGFGGRVRPATVEEFRDPEPFDAVVCSLVLVLGARAQSQSCGACIRCSGPAVSCAISSTWPARAGGGGCSEPSTRPVWPHLCGNCHTHRETERAIVEAGFEVDTSRREWTLPGLGADAGVGNWRWARARKP